MFYYGTHTTIYLVVNKSKLIYKFKINYYEHERFLKVEQLIENLHKILIIK